MLVRSGQLYFGLHSFFSRIPLASLPNDEFESGEWLIKNFKEKDDIIENFRQTGNLPGQPVSLDRRPYSLICFVTWCCIMGAPLLYFFTTASLLSLIICGCLLLGCKSDYNCCWSFGDEFVRITTSFRRLIVHIHVTYKKKLKCNLK